MLSKFLLACLQVLPLLAIPANGAVQAVFAHYLVGTITSDHASQDIRDGKAAGFDAFALDLLSSDPNGYAAPALANLFQAADDQGFSLFLSLDLGGSLTDPSQFMPIVRNYSTRNSYYKVGGRPFLSTFSGGTESFGSSSVNEFWTSAFQQYNLNPYFIPNFDNVPNYPNDFFTTFPVADGVFSWETAWPAPDSPAGTNVSSSIDTQAIEEAHTAGKVYMMPWSSLQYKNLPGQFYYRIGEAVFGQRIAQISSAQPDYVELITWNDSGESHYAGDIWPEAIAGTNIPNYAIYDHSGFQKVITPVIQALKAGATDTSLIDAGENPTGAVWYHPILTSNPCSNGRRAGIEGAEDAVDYAIFLPQGAEGMIEIYSGGSRIGSMQAGGGLNTGKALGLGVGSVEVYVLDREGNVLVRVNGSTPVLGEDDPLCNFNFVVQGF